MINLDFDQIDTFGHVDFRRFSNTAEATAISPDLVSRLIIPIIAPWWRFDSLNRQWYNFNGSAWVAGDYILTDIVDVILRLFNFIAELNKPQADKVHQADFAKQVKSRMEQSPFFLIAPEDWDANGQFLNTPGGVVDLLTGELLPNESKYLAINVAGWTPQDDEDGTRCPHYMQHLDFVSNGNKEIAEYLELLSGYLLTGYVFMQEFYCWYGHGANGKSVLAGIWMKCMGKYAVTANSGQFTVAGSMAHKEQDARLVGKRLVVSEEVSGARYTDAWDLNKIKDFTDGNTNITARQMFGKTFSFPPQFKLLFIGNQKPSLSTTDHAIERRLRLTLFPNRVPEHLRDLLFGEKLKEEGPYILNRMIKAAVQFNNTKKLLTPGSVAESSREYIKSENVISVFIDEMCEVSKFSHVIFVDFYNKLSEWCDKNGFDVPARKRASSMLNDLGYSPLRSSGTRMIAGIKLKDTKILSDSRF